MIAIRQAIQGRVNQGPADNIDLHCAAMRNCDMRADKWAALWGLIHAETAAMEAEHLIVRHASGCWTLPGGVQMEDEEPPPSNTLRPGTSVPANFKHLVPTRK